MTTEHAPILVFGATGLLGQALLRVGRSRGLTMIGAARRGTDEFCDVRNVDSVVDLVARLRPRAIINAAAVVDIAACENQPEEAYSTNGRAVYFLVDAARQHDCPLVHVSTDHYFSGDGDRLHDENAPVQLVNEYARSKFAGEAFAFTYPNSLVLRTNITGFRGWPGKPTFAEWMFNAIEKDSVVSLYDDFVTSTMDATGMAQATISLLLKGTKGLLNVAARQASTKKHFVETVALHLGKSLSRSHTASVLGLRPKRANSLGLDVRQAEAVLGLSLPSLDEVAASLIREYHEQCSITRRF